MSTARLGMFTATFTKACTKQVIDFKKLLNFSVDDNWSPYIRQFSQESDEERFMLTSSKWQIV